MESEAEYLDKIKSAINYLLEEGVIEIYGCNEEGDLVYGLTAPENIN